MFRFNTGKLNTDIVLGCGSNSKIYPYHKFPNDDRWAVKYLIAQGFDDLLKIMQEIVIGFSCDHPSILPIKGYYIAPAEPTGWDVYIKLPRMQGTLAHFLERRRANSDFVPKENVIKYFYSLACGLEYLHSRKIAHRDIKPANILFDKEGKIKLGDVGVAKFIPEEELGYFRTDKAGTEFYIAPEIQNDKGPNPKLMKKDFFKADSWSLGVVMAEICTLNMAQTNSNALQKNDAKTYLNDFFATRYNDPVLLKLIIDLLHAEDPSQRISVGQARKILETTYPDILGLKEKEIDPDLKFIKSELAKTWDKTFKFEADKTFSVQGKSINWIDDGKVRELIKDLGRDIKGKKIENLKTFELNLECCANITDQTTEIISLGLESSLKRLEELSLNFVGCNNITNRGVHTLSVSIGSNLTALQSLSLDFGWCKEITDEGIRSLKDCIAKLNNLQDLSLSLRSCEKITDSAVEELATGIEHAHDNLESLGLNFWGCEKITDQAIEFIQKYIGRQFHKLHRYSLNFVNCNKISDGAARNLSNHIQSSLRRLDYISLNFIGCYEITLQTQTIMIKSLKKAISQCELLFDIPK